MGQGADRFKRRQRILLIAFGAWYAVVIAACLVLMVLDRFVAAAIAAVASVVLSLGYAAAFSRIGRQVAINQAAEQGPITWLPPAGSRRPVDFDLEEETERLRKYGSRAWSLAVLYGIADVLAIVAIGVLGPIEKVLRNDDAWALGIPLAGSIIAIGLSMAAAVGWQKRYDAVAASGWRRAEALITLSESRGGSSKVSIRYGDHSRIVLLPVPSLHYVGRRARTASQEIWVGGGDRAMVVLFPPDDRGWRPYAVPARAREPRR